MLDITGAGSLMWGVSRSYGSPIRVIEQALGLALLSPRVTALGDGCGKHGRVLYDEMTINTGWQFPILATIVAALFPALEAGVAAQDTVDFRYSPPEWQTAI